MKRDVIYEEVIILSEPVQILSEYSYDNFATLLGFYKQIASNYPFCLQCEIIFQFFWSRDLFLWSIKTLIDSDAETLNKIIIKRGTL
jgi:hypothetical protein